jgi:hypothetical protein
MTEFPRLLHFGSPEQKAMLEAAQVDAPSASTQKRLLLALGVGSAAVSIGASAQAASNVGDASAPTASASPSIPISSGIGETAASTGVPSLAAPAATALAAPAVTISTALIAKWLIVATLSLTAVGLGAVAGRGIAQNTPPWQAAHQHGNPVSVPGTSLSREVSREASPGVTGTDSSTHVAPTLPLPQSNHALDPSATEEQVTTHFASSRPSANRPVAVEQLTVSGETALVDKAREALRQGDPAGCLSLLEIRRKGVRGGVLAPEATVLRIDALRALGQRARATQEATRFVHDYPDSPLVERIRDLLPTPEP